MPAPAKRQRRPGPGRLSAEDTAALQDRLLDAAFALFTKRGYGDASMEQIAKDAGASTKTLYSRFSNKGEILEAVVRRNIERTVTRHVRSFVLQPTEAEPREFLIKFGMQVVLASLEAETLGMQRVTFAESVRWPGLRRMYREVNGGAVSVIERAMLLWRAQGKLEFEEDAHRLAALCYAMMTHEQRIGSILGDPMTQADARRYVELAVDIFLKGISPAPKAAAKKK